MWKKMPFERVLTLSKADNHSQEHKRLLFVDNKRDAPIVELTLIFHALRTIKTLN